MLSLPLQLKRDRSFKRKGYLYACLVLLPYHSFISLSFSSNPYIVQDLNPSSLFPSSLIYHFCFFLPPPLPFTCYLFPTLSLSLAFYIWSLSLNYLPSFKTVVSNLVVCPLSLVPCSSDLSSLSA